MRVNSSIFNSSFDAEAKSKQNESPLFILKILLLTVAISIAYAGLSKSIRFPSFLSQSQFQDNQYKTEQFIARLHRIQSDQYSVVVGSSLTALLKEEFFALPTMNLAYSGGSPLTGLEMIIQSKVKFRKVYVDATVLRPVDAETLGLLESRFDVWRIQNIPITRVDRQPVSLMTNYLKMKFGISAKKEFTQKHFDIGIESQQKADREFDESQRAKFTEMVTLLKNKIEQIQEKGTDVVILEMPLDTQISSLGMYQFMRTELHRILDSNGKIRWYSNPSSELKTMDGMHLTPDSAEVFARELN